jgi:hypothetical protein
MARRRALRKVSDWPDLSPGAANAWLLLLTTKPPDWKDPFLQWSGAPPTLGEPHQGFFYPDPLGFWAEVRRWVTLLFRLNAPGWATADALSLSALLHVENDPARVAWALERCRPVVTLFLDEAARVTAGIEASGDVYSIPDPHRPGTMYDGWWGRTPDGGVVGKSPQHPASHRLYRASDMDVFLRAAPVRS